MSDLFTTAIAYGLILSAVLVTVVQLVVAFTPDGDREPTKHAPAPNRWVYKRRPYTGRHTRFGWTS